MFRGSTPSQESLTLHCRTTTAMKPGWWTYHFQLQPPTKIYAADFFWRGFLFHWNFGFAPDTMPSYKNSRPFPNTLPTTIHQGRQQKPKIFLQMFQRPPRILLQISGGFAPFSHRHSLSPIGDTDDVDNVDMCHPLWYESCEKIKNRLTLKRKIFEQLQQKPWTNKRTGSGHYIYEFI